MRIVSKYHDYYDGVQAHGQDQSLVYVRNEQEISLEEAGIESLPCYRISNGNVTTRVIGFCGEVHLAVELSNHVGTARKEHVCYSTQEVEQALVKLAAEDHSWIPTRDAFFKESRYPHWERNRLRKQQMEHFFGRKKEMQRKFGDFFQKYKVPVFMTDTRLGADYRLQEKFVLNPRLEPIQFYKVKDAFSAFQEISMYISGVLGVNTPETVEVSDDSLMRKKGFWDYSFKTMKGEKKPRRRGKIK